jgi:hypothetical protein
MIFSWAGCHNWYQSDYMHQSLISNLMVSEQLLDMLCIAYKKVVVVKFKIKFL